MGMNKQRRLWNELVERLMEDKLRELQRSAASGDPEAKIRFLKEHARSCPLASRADAVTLITKQLYNSKIDSSLWHYGRMELRELMDFIYGGIPDSPEEMIMKESRNG